MGVLVLLGVLASAFERRTSADEAEISYEAEKEKVGIASMISLTCVQQAFQTCLGGVANTVDCPWVLEQDNADDKCTGTFNSKDYVFQQYQRAAFANIRTAVNLQGYKATCNANMRVLNTNSGSGSAFWFTDANAYLVKSLSKEEVAWLDGGGRAALVQHFQQRARNTFLAPIVAMYTITRPKQVTGSELKDYYLFMANIDAGRTVMNLPKPVTYDLKGSYWFRTSDSQPFKDQNFNARVPADFKLDHGDDLAATLVADTDFLKGQNRIDYSMLLTIRAQWGVYQWNNQVFLERLEDTKHKFTLSMGIIDYLGEQTTSRWILGQSIQSSTVDAAKYAPRFNSFMDKWFFGVVDKTLVLGDITVEQIQAYDGLLRAAVQQEPPAQERRRHRRRHRRHHA